LATTAATTAAGVSQSRARACPARGCQARTLDVPASRNQESDREEYEQRFLDIETVVVGEGRRQGAEQRCGRDCLSANAVGQQEKQKNHPCAEYGGNQPQRPLVERRQRRLPARPRDRQRQVVQRRTVVVLRVVPILAGFEQRAELDGLVGLVMVHGPHIRLREATRERDHQRDRHQGAERDPAHLTGVP
jgi:hypothetical protein